MRNQTRRIDYNSKKVTNNLDVSIIVRIFALKKAVFQVTLRPHLVCETHEGGDGKLLLSFIDSQIMQKVAVCNGLLFQT